VIINVTNAKRQQA